MAFIPKDDETREYKLVLKKISNRGRPKKERIVTPREFDSKAEELLWMRLRNRNFFGLRFRRKYEFDAYISEFFSHENQLSIEIHSDSEWKKSKLPREETNLPVGHLRLKVLRVTDREVLANLEGVLQDIAALAVK